MRQWRQETGTSLGGENTAQFQATCRITVAVDLQMSLDHLPWMFFQVFFSCFSVVPYPRLQRNIGV